MFLKIKEIRVKKNITQDQLCELSGVKKRSLLDYESGKTDIPFSKLHNIAKALEVSIYDLIEDENEQKDGFKENEVSEPNDIYKKNTQIKNETIKLLEENCNLLKEQVLFYKKELEDCRREKNISKTVK